MFEALLCRAVSSRCDLSKQRLARESPCTVRLDYYRAGNRQRFRNIFVGLVPAFVGYIKIIPQTFFNQWATDILRCETMTCLIAYSAAAHQTDSKKEKLFYTLPADNAQCCRKLQV